MQSLGIQSVAIFFQISRSVKKILVCMDSVERSKMAALYVSVIQVMLERTALTTLMSAVVNRVSTEVPARIW